MTRALAGFALAVALSTAVALPSANPQPVAAAGCIRFSASHWDATGNDNYASNLNGEWVRIHNYCSVTKRIGGWKIHDYGRKHVYKFASGTKIQPGESITLYSGRGTNTAHKRYWQRSYGAVWNNDPPEWAYLRNGSGTLKSKWTEY